MVEGWQRASASELPDAREAPGVDLGCATCSDPDSGPRPRRLSPPRWRLPVSFLTAPSVTAVPTAGRQRRASATPTSRSTATAASTCARTGSATATRSTPGGSPAAPCSRCAPPTTSRAFDLDFLLPVTARTVDGRRASYAKPRQHEVRITPRAADRRTASGSPSGHLRRASRPPLVRRREQLAGERPRGGRHEPAPHGAVVVPVERPPARQGPDGHHHHGARAATRCSPTAGPSRAGSTAIT